jgi:hypothetical protein
MRLPGKVISSPFLILQSGQPTFVPISLPPSVYPPVTVEFICKDG